MDDDDNELRYPLAPFVRHSFVDERRQRLDALQAAMEARRATMTDQTWACLIHNLATRERAWGLLADVAVVEARIRASQGAGSDGDGDGDRVPSQHAGARLDERAGP